MVDKAIKNSWRLRLLAPWSAWNTASSGFRSVYSRAPHMSHEPTRVVSCQPHNSTDCILRRTVTPPPSTRAPRARVMLVAAKCLAQEGRLEAAISCTRDVRALAARRSALPGGSSGVARSVAHEAFKLEVKPYPPEHVHAHGHHPFGGAPASETIVLFKTCEY